MAGRYRLCGSFAFCLLLTIIAALTGVVHGQLSCFTTRGCMVPTVSPNPATIRDCCLGDGFFFQIPGDEACTECIVFGWLNGSTFEGREDGTSYELLVGVSKGDTTNRFFAYSLEIMPVPNPAPVQGRDFRVSSAETLRPRQATNVTVQVSFEIDNIALELRESFQLRLIPGNDASRPQSANEFLLQDIELTIIDSDIVIVEFTEDDYRANEAELQMPVRVTKNREIATPLVLQVTPMNVSAVINASLPLPAPQLPPLNLLEPNRATSFPEENRDFSPDPVNITFAADEGNAASEISIFIPIVNDEVDEANVENFIVLLSLLEATNPSSVNVSQPARISSVCRIVDDDDIRIGFERASYTFQEAFMEFDDTIVLIKENNRSTERTFEVVIEVGSAFPGGVTARADFGVDYNIGPDRAQTRTFLPSMQRLPFAIRLLDDDSPEGTEAFQLQSRNSNPDPDYDTPPQIAFANTFVVIEDDDNIFVGWEETFTEVSEGDGTVQLRILIMNLTAMASISGGFFLQLQTVPGTAVSTPGNPTDYVTIIPAATPLNQFTDVIRAQNVSVVITNDLIFEQTESFSLSIIRPADLPASVIITEDVTVVRILDNDLVRIGFVETAISVSEQGGSVDLQVAVLNGTLESPITVELSTSDATAVSPEDYIAISPMLLTFNSTSTSTSVTVTIVNNDIFESLETFTASLTLVSPAGNSRISIDPSEATVTIQDEETVVIGYTSTAISVTEGGTANFSAQVMSGNLGDLEVQVVQSTQDGTATGGVGADYATETRNLSFSSQSITLPLSIETFTDGLTEGAENFTANLGGPITVTVIAQGGMAPEAASRVTLNPNVLSITILDIDFAVIGFRPVTYTVREDMQNVLLTIAVIQGNLQREVNVTFFTDDNTAIAPGDYMSLTTTLSFTGTQSQTATVTINADSLFESDETFFGMLQLLPTLLNVSVAPSQANVTIQDASNVTIGFTSQSYSIEESAGSVTFIVSVLTGTLNRMVEVGFSTADGSAIAPDDYTALTRTLTFDASTTTREVTVSVSDDSILEIDESFFGRLTLLTTEVSSRVAINPAEATAIIGDNDRVVIGFERNFSSVREDVGNTTLRVAVLSGVLQRMVVVTFNTQDGTAQANSDYGPVINRQLIFDQTTSFVDVQVVIVDDFIVEPAIEAFEGVLTLTTTSADVDILPDVARVEIVDNDNVTIGFTQDAYDVPESVGFLNVTVEVVGTLGRAVTVSLTTQDGTAVSTGEADFRSTSVELEFSPTILSRVVMIEIIDDVLLERSEMFTSMLTLTTTDVSIMLVPQQASITIIDNDRVVIGFRQPLYSVDESAGSVNIGVVVRNGQLRRSVVVTVSTEDGTAQDGLDYSTRTQVLTFDQNNVGFNISIPVLNNDIHEPTEDFFGRLMTNDQDAFLSPNSTRIRIIDDDTVFFTFRQPIYMFLESVGMGEVCVDRLNPTVQTIRIMISGALQPGLGSIDQVLTFLPENNESCVRFPISDDEIALEEVETLTFTLNIIDAQTGVSLGAFPTARVGILDDDELVLTVVKTTDIPENIGTAEVCVDFSNQFAQGFQISAQSMVPMNMSDIVAGTPGVDYSRVNQSLSVTLADSAAGQRCFTFSVEDDSAVEEPMECLVIRIELPQNAPEMLRIAPGNESTLCCIQDDDNVTIGFTPAVYREDESTRTVVLNVSVTSGILQRAVEVSFTVANGTAFSPGDFVDPVEIVLQFDSIFISRTVTITIVDDNILENDEVFFGNLASTDAQVIVAPQTATVTIVEDNDEVTIGFQPVDYTVSEGDGSVPLIVVLQEGSLERNVNVEFQTNPGTATSAAPADYVRVQLNVEFSPGILQRSVSVPIVDDSIVEGMELFFAFLSDAGDPVVIDPDEATVFILDEGDNVTIGFEQTTFIVTEGTVVEVCAVVRSGELERNAIVSISSSDGTAVAPSDYTSVQAEFTFSQTVRRQCVNVTTVDDPNNVEEVEVFSLRLSSADGSVVLAPDTATITITDDEVVRVRFEQPQYTFSEGIGQGSVCLRKDLATSETVTVSVFTVDGSALSGDDYVGGSFPVTLGTQANARQCLSITIIADALSEEREDFTVNIQTPTNPRVQTGNPSTATVFIDDLGEEVNDTVIGDPLMTVPILVPESDLAQLGDGGSERVSLCYEIHGRPREYFNFVTDDCASVNAHYVNVTRYLNVINRVGIRAVGSGARPQCRNISVDLNGCSAMVDGSPLGPSGRYSFEGIRVRRYPDRVRVAVPNCNDLSLVIWIFCQTRELHDPFNGGTISTRMIKIVVMRGLNFGHRNAHGLLGQFWNIPVRVSPFAGVLRGRGTAEERYTLNLTRPGSTRVASFTGFLYDLTWEFEEGPCLYVGNRQGGQIYEVQSPNDRIIEGSSYKDYIVPGLFSERDYTFARFNNSLCN